jgi:hypothetical protein
MSERLTQVTVIRDGRGYGSYRPGEIGKVKDGLWMICCPLCNNLGELRTHQVTENEDNTITISPSLVCHGSIYEGLHQYRSCTAHYFVERNQIRWC